MKRNLPNDRFVSPSKKTLFDHSYCPSTTDENEKESLPTNGGVTDHTYSTPHDNHRISVPHYYPSTSHGTMSTRATTTPNVRLSTIRTISLSVPLLSTGITANVRNAPIIRFSFLHLPRLLPSNIVTITNRPQLSLSPLPIESSSAQIRSSTVTTPLPRSLQTPTNSSSQEHLSTELSASDRTMTSTRPTLTAYGDKDMSPVEELEADGGENTLNESAAVHEAPVVLPNYSAFCYNSRNLHDGAHIGSISETCPHCHAKKWPSEPPGMCCANGKVDVPLLGPPPEPLRTLMSHDTPAAKEFRGKLRKYNSCFVMTSFQDLTRSHSCKSAMARLPLIPTTVSLSFLAALLFKLRPNSYKPSFLNFTSNTKTQPGLPNVPFLLLEMTLLVK